MISLVGANEPCQSAPRYLIRFVSFRFVRWTSPNIFPVFIVPIIYPLIAIDGEKERRKGGKKDLLVEFGSRFITLQDL